MLWLKSTYLLVNVVVVVVNELVAGRMKIIAKGIREISRIIAIVMTMISFFLLSEKIKIVLDTLVHSLISIGSRTGSKTTASICSRLSKTLVFRIFIIINYF